MNGGRDDVMCFSLSQQRQAGSPALPKTESSTHRTLSSATDTQSCFHNSHRVIHPRLMFRFWYATLKCQHRH